MHLGVALVLVVGLWEPVDTMDAAFCTDDVVHIINDVVGIANSIAQTAVDCTMPGLSEVACSADISGLLANLLDVAGLIVDMTTTCGNLENGCAGNILASVEIIAGLSCTLIASAGDCQSDPFLCSYDVISAVDTVNGLIFNIIAAIRVCDRSQIPGHHSNQDFSDPGDTANVMDRYNRLEFQNHRNWGNFQRRLQEVIADNRALGNATNVDSTSTDHHGMRVRLSVQLQHLRSQLTAKGVKDLTTPESLLKLLAKPAEDVVIV